MFCKISIALVAAAALGSAALAPTSRGAGVGNVAGALRRSHLLLDPLNRTSPDPEHLGDLQDAHALLELLLCLALQGDIDLGPSEPRTLSNRALEPCLDPLPNYRSLELGKGARDLKHKPSHRRGRVNGLLVQVEIDTDRLKVLDCAKQVDERTSEPVDGPRHHHVEVPPTGVFQHAIKAGSLGTTFGSADASVRVDLHNFPTAAPRDPPQFPYLVLYRLSVGADPNIDRRRSTFLGMLDSLDKFAV